ncbi:MAG: hypothetical protein KBT58_11055 [Bizionia sp.]|nr:hypothetical protein [Bizionia sp.]
MEEFFKQNYSLLNKSVVLIAVIAGIISYKKFKGTPGYFFILIVVYLFLIDLLGSYYLIYTKVEFLKPLYNSVFRKNYWWFTITFDVGVIALFSVLYQKIIDTPRFKIILKSATVLYLCFALIFIGVKHQELFRQTFPLLQILGALIIILCCAFYLYELLKSDALLRMHKDLYFYVTIAIFLWWIIVTPLSFYDLYFSNADWNFIILKWQILLLSNILMYLTFSFALLWCKPQND